MNARGLRIGLIGPVPPPAGGMANQTRQLARLLREEGAEVELVAVNAAYRPAWIGTIRGVRALARLLPYLAQLWRTAGRVQLFHIMANSGWSWHLFAAPAVWIAKARGIRVLVNYRGGEADAFLARSLRTVKPTLARADAIAVPSGFLAAVFGRRGILTQLVPNIIDLSRFSPTDIRPDSGKPGFPHVIVARNLEPIYDNATALRAFRLLRNQYPQARLTLAGAGPERQKLEQLADGLGLNGAVVFTGSVDNQKMPELYRAADIFLNPSLVDNMPISVLEALASGVPVVSTDVGGVPYIVEDGGTALLVPPGDADAMAGALLRLAADAPLRQALSSAGLNAARQYAWPNVRERLFQVYGQMLGQESLASQVERYRS